MLAAMLLFAAFLFVPHTAADAAGTRYAAFEDAKIYAEKDQNAAVLGTAAKNEIFEVSATETVGLDVWCAVLYEGAAGYMRRADLYVYRESLRYEVRSGKATASKMGEKIHYYTAPGAAESAGVLRDGTALEIAAETEDGAYYLIRTAEGAFYLPHKNVTNGITLYQRLALIVGLIGLVVAISIFVLLRMSRKRKRGKRG